MNTVNRLSEFSFSVLRPGAPEQRVPFKDGVATAWGVSARITIKGDRLDLEIEARGEAVVTLWLQPNFTRPFPLLPGFMIGDNRPEDTGPAYPQLAPVQDLNLPKMLSPYWGIRADRATAPVAFLFGDQGMRALAVPPYSGEGSGAANGLRLCLARGIGILADGGAQFLHRRGGLLQACRLALGAPAHVGVARRDFG